MKRVTDNDLTRAPISDLIQTRYVDLIGMTSPADRKTKQAIIGALKDRIDDFTLENLAHLLLLITRLSKIDKESLEIYNSALGQIIHIHTPYRCQYVDTRLLNEQNGLREVDLWLDNKVRIANQDFVRKTLSKIIVECTAQQFAEITSKLIDRGSNHVGLLCIRFSELCDKDKCKAILHFNKSIIYNYPGDLTIVVEKKHLQSTTSPKVLVKVMDELVCSMKNGKSSYTGGNKGVVLDMTRSDINEILFPAMGSESNKVNEIIQMYDSNMNP